MKNNLSAVGRVTKVQASPTEKLSALAFETVRWFLASVVLYFDYQWNSLLLRAITLELVPFPVVATLEVLVSFLAIANVGVNFAAMIWCCYLDYRTVAEKFLNIFQVRSRNQPPPVNRDIQGMNSRHRLSESVGELVFCSLSNNASYEHEQRTSWADRSLPLPPTKQQTFESNLPSVPRSLSANRSVLDIHNLYQLDSSFEQALPDPEEQFEPSVYYDTRYSRGESLYQVSTFEKKVEADDESLVDLLDVSSYYSTHPDEHPLTNKKKITSSRDDYFSGSLLFTERKRRTKQVEEAARSIRSRRSGSTSFVSRPSRSPTSIAHKPISIDVIDLIDSYDLDSVYIPRYEERLRLFVGTHIVIPLVENINTLNKAFRDVSGVPGYTIGRTKIEDLEALCTPDLHPALKTLPFVLTYLKSHPNTKHLISRLNMWSQMAQLYCFNSVPNAQANVTTFPSEAPSKDPLPTDSELVLKLFATFMDFKLSPFPLTFNRKPDAPFSNVFIVETAAKPNSLQLGSLGYYIEVCDTTPTSFKYHAHHRSRWITTATENGLVVLLAFIAHTEMYFNGYVHGTDLATIGLTLHELEEY